MSMNHSQFHQLREALQVASLSVTLTVRWAHQPGSPPRLVGHQILKGSLTGPRRHRHPAPYAPPTDNRTGHREVLSGDDGGRGRRESKANSYDDQKQMNLVSARRKRSRHSGDEIPTRKGEQGENEKPVSSGN
ncbi:hypothetical protein CPLU01_01389 [Colletotrichum plurivorum]|uniref:Uncharacterized protein n=1 Tax=Colletotrichum plurivorum TaxID=2175906 RepID=A0A8H6U1W3_9PEZI|nr:hypothetical protein CPLU01_01389 [Colletotrichum plurivorum]